jgi:hypothetical protein
MSADTNIHSQDLPAMPKISSIPNFYAACTIVGLVLAGLIGLIVYSYLHPRPGCPPMTVSELIGYSASSILFCGLVILLPLTGQVADVVVNAEGVR